ncbi:TraG family conjugative transposon ATPase [Chitinophaga sp. 212800010-3]|uniref:TraG family conjugative transposon ATPase n=1 Tax=unclassified Chitinophaga TaxID=2619133 RepID=UPI002DF34749|nr:TraG family conjugative transposon ATPase [Chitinophaga sp. 212800010-3]
MEKWLKNIFPIADIEHNCILSKQGDITIAYRVDLPEIFTGHAEDFEGWHQGLIKAIKLLPKNTVFHKQDWFVKNRYKGEFSDADSFLKKRSQEYFNNRPFLDHQCYIMLTKRSLARKGSTSLMSNLIRPNIVPEQTLSAVALQEFEDVAGQFQKVLSDVGIILHRMGNDELLSHDRRAGLVEKYLYLLDKEDELLVQDIELRDQLRVGNKDCQLFTLSGNDSLPSVCGSRINYDKYSTDRTKFSIGFASHLGLLLPCNHIYNQYIIIDDAQQTLKKFESKRLRLQSLAAYSRENAISRDAVNDFLNESISQQRLPVKAHFNVLAWSESAEEAKDIRNLVTSALAQMDAIAKQETIGAAQIFWSGIPGNAADFPANDTFDTFAEQACCFLNLESNYRSDNPQESIRFCDRLTGKPVFVDPYTAPRMKGISSNMGTLVCGTSGGGKSMTVNHMLNSMYEQGAHCVILDIGGSYRGLCDLVGGYYFTYTEQNPIRFNPFYIPEGQVLDTEKKESLKSLLVALWKQESESFNRSEYVALSNALTGYYKYLSENPTAFPCFNTFYEYLQNFFIDELKLHRLKDRDFDIDNFLYVLRPFYRGGEFDYLLNAEGKQDLLNQRFTVIEMDNIKEHPVLFSVVTLICMELFISKVRKLAGIRKVFVIDEAWKAIAKPSMAEFTKYGFKTFRKFNGVPIVITQELDDLISSPIIKDAIIANADVKILMDMRKFMNKFDHLQAALGLSEKAKSILLSVNKDNREIFMEIGGQVAKVYKNDLCPHEYYAFTTEGKERVKVLEYAESLGSMEKAIEQMVADRKKIV